MNRLFYILIILLPFIFSCRFEPDNANKQETIVCLTFDDNLESVYTNAFPIMKDYGFRGTVFTVSGYVGNHDRLSWSQLDSLYNNKWEIGGHTLNHAHLSVLTPDEAEYQVSADFDSLSNHGFKPVSFAFPFGECPVTYYPIVTKYYKNVRSTVNISMQNPIDRSRLGTYGVEGTMTAEFLTGRIMQGIAEKENLIIYMFHNIGENHTYNVNDFSPEEFRAFIIRLHQMKIKVLPLNEALDYLSD